MRMRNPFAHFLLKTLIIVHQSHAPGRESATGGDERERGFWVSGSVRKALDVLIDEGIYIGQVVEECDGGVEEEWVRVVEPEPSDKTVALMDYRNDLTETDCCRVCRQMVNIIKVLHEHGVAHCNIHPGNFLVARSVSSRSS